MQRVDPDGKDTLYNQQKQKLPLKKSELQAKGVTFPIHLDIPVEQSRYVIAVQQTNSLKQSIETGMEVEISSSVLLQMTDNEKMSITSQK